ncbi:MAG: hypothetical protein OXH12_02270 [Chloroflexi bacterium]|nr:hypothetical protein [Chloroflexota bacterium]
MALTVRTLISLLLLAALAFGACGGGPSGPQPVSGEAAADEAAPLTDELRELLEEVAEVRGLEAPPGLQVRAVAPEDLEDAYWEGWTEQEVRYWLDSRTTFLQILGHLDRDESQDLLDLQLGFIGGFYSYDETLWMVTDKERIDLDDLTQWELLTLVHEMVHAIQDHHFDLAKTSGATSHDIDAGLAWSAVVEGDAIYHEGRLAEAALGIPADEVLTIGAWDDLPAGLLREFYFPYTAGADAVAWFIEAHGRDALNALLLDPPSATSQILRPELLASGWEPEYLYTFATLPERQIRVSLGILWAPDISGRWVNSTLPTTCSGMRPSIATGSRATRTARCSTLSRAGQGIATTCSRTPRARPCSSPMCVSRTRARRASSRRRIAPSRRGTRTWRRKAM